MSLCARLEVQLTTTHSETRRLLEAVLYHVLKDSHSEGGEGAFARA